MIPKPCMRCGTPEVTPTWRWIKDGTDMEIRYLCERCYADYRAWVLRQGAYRPTETR